LGGSRAHGGLLPLLPPDAVLHRIRQGKAGAAKGDVVMKKLLLVLLALPALAFASGAKVALDAAPINIHDKASLQRGATAFVNHCLNCHGATAMRYGRLSEIGLTENQIRENLLFTGEKVGDSMSAAMPPAVAKAAFGVVP